MKQLKIYFAAICCLLNFQVFFGQTYNVPFEKGQNIDFDINPCIAYFMKDYKGNVKNHQVVVYNLSNGNKIAQLLVNFTTEYIKRIENINNGPGWFNPITGWSDHTYKKEKQKWHFRKNLLLNKDGFPLKEMNLSNAYILHIDDNRFYVAQANYNEENDFDVDRKFDVIKCFDLDGNEVWVHNNTSKIYDLSFSPNNIYLAGFNYTNPVYVVMDKHSGKEIKKEEKKNDSMYSSAFTRVSLTPEGVALTEKERNINRGQIIKPYETNDNSFQERLISKKYNTNNANDQVTLGIKYLNGDGFSKDASKAFEWFQKAARQNNDNGLYRLGYCYYNGLGVNHDKGEAATQYEKSANLGNKDAMAAVSKMYINGDGIPKNMSRAMYWQEKLAFQGDKDAQKFVVANQSIEYEKTNISASEVRDKALYGFGLKDYGWAEFCIKRAIELGNNDARLDYGLWLTKGEGVQKDYSKAEEYLTPFAESGIAEAVAALSKIYLSLNDQKKALAWTEKAALQGDAEAQFTMAVHYENGVGVKKNAEAAFDMFKRAADNGNQEAIRRLVLAYGLGKGVKKDYNASVSYFDKLDLPIASLLANNVFFGENGMKKNKTLGLLLLHRAGYRGDKRSAELWEIYNK